MMYKRKSTSDHTVEWNPEHDDEAEEAMLEVVGKTGVEVDSKTASKIREEYQNRTEDKE